MENATTINQKERSYSAYLKPNRFNHVNAKVQIVAIPSRVQARLDAAQTALILGFNEHDIPVLVRNGLLKPLGDDIGQNSRKYFAGIEIMTLAENPEWLSKATQVVSQNWNIKNANRKKNKLVAA